MTNNRSRYVGSEKFSGICYSVPRCLADILPDVSIFSEGNSDRVLYLEAEARKDRARALKRVSNRAARRYS